MYVGPPESADGATDRPDEPGRQSPRSATPRLSRRTVLGAVGVGAVGLTAAATTVGVVATRPDRPNNIVEFRGDHQAGITTAAQDRLHFVSFDVITTDRAELTRLLRDWTLAAERMTRGLETYPNGATGLGQYVPPSDTGEALGLSPANLTLTIRFGASLFTSNTAGDRFGISVHRPEALVELPAFAKDELEPGRSGGDICVQACADDPQVAVHAIRNLARMGFGVVSVRWSQLGFGRTSSTTTTQQTPRNMFGFKDGTANIKAEDTDLLDKSVRVTPNDNHRPAQWMTGGSYLVARRIRMHIERWDRAALSEQEIVVGRSKDEGAPLGQTGEFDAPDFHITNGSVPVIARTAHLRLAHPDNLNGVQILRRGYNFTDGSDGFGHLDAGLFFIAYCRNPHTQFVPMQRALAARDALGEYITHTGSALFACPPGLADGEWWGQRLFES